LRQRLWSGAERWQAQFNLVIGSKLTSIIAPIAVDDNWHHIAGVLGEARR